MAVVGWLFSLYESAFFALATKREVPHVEQDHTWDCGHSCLRMVMLSLGSGVSDGVSDGVSSGGPRDVTNALHTLEELTHSHKPLWTIELLAYLHTHGVDATLHTTCVGTGSHHECIEWYRESSMVEDAARVAALFERASEEEWSVRKVSV